MLESKYGNEKISMMRRVFMFLGLLSRKKQSDESVTDCVRRCEERVANIEQVTMSWTTGDLTSEQLRDLGMEK